MKKSLQMILMAAAIAAASCSTDENDLFEEWGVQPGQENMMPGGTNDSNGSASIGDLTSFDIQLNEEALTESETIPADDEDYIADEIRRSAKATLVLELIPEHMTGKLVNEK